MPGFVGLNQTVTVPFLPDVTFFEIPGPVILTVAPATPFFPFVTFTTIFCDFPLLLRTFGPAVTVLQISGSGFGVGFAAGGTAGAVTSVCAEPCCCSGSSPASSSPP